MLTDLGYGCGVAVRHGARRLFAARGFATATLATLTAAFAAWLTVFALVQGVLLDPLPYGQPDRLVDVGHRTPGLGVLRAGQSSGGWALYQRESRSFESFGIYSESTINLTDPGLAPEQAALAMVSPDVFAALDVAPLHGMVGTAETVAAPPYPVVLSHALWTRRYGADPAIVGQSIEMNGRPRRVIGVMPATFGFPSVKTALWMPASFSGADGFGDLSYGSVARLRSGVTAEAAEAELSALVSQLPVHYADARPDWIAEAGLTARVEPLRTVVVGDISQSLWLVLAAASLVLLLASANVTNLFLIRTEQRRREIGICRAIGASTGQVFLTFLVESLMLTVGAATFAFLIARPMLAWFVGAAAGQIPRVDTLQITATSLTVLVAVAIISGVVFAAGSLLTVRRVALREAGRTTSASRTEQQMRRVLTAAQVGLALAVVLVAALLLRSFWHLTHQPLGFTPASVMTFELAPPFRGYESFAQAAGFHQRLLDRVESLPGVDAAGAITTLPLSGFAVKPFLRSQIFIEQPAGPPREAHDVNWKLFVPGYFEALGIPLLQGTRFARADHFDDTSPLLVSESFARRYLGDTPLGRRVRHAASPRLWTVVGIVGDVKDDSLRDAGSEAAYVPVLDQTEGAPYIPRSMSVAVQSSLPPAALQAALREVVRELDPRLPLSELQSMDALVARALARDRLLLSLVAAAAALATLVGAFGLYGALSYRITQQRREFGIHLALGASTADLRRVIGREAVGVVGWGLGLGAVLSLVLGRGLAGILFGVQPTDAPTMAAGVVAIALIATAIVAWSWRRVREISPLEALKTE